MADDKDVFDEHDQEALDDFDQLTELRSQHVLTLAEEEDISDGMLSPLLLRIAVNSRVVAYVGSTAKPSGGGFDRFRHDIEDVIRETKKDAEAFIARAKESLAVSPFRNLRASFAPGP
jgi:hypothetical protein